MSLRKLDCSQPPPVGHTWEGQTACQEPFPLLRPAPVRQQLLDVSFQRRTSPPGASRPAPALCLGTVASAPLPVKPWGSLALPASLEKSQADSRPLERVRRTHLKSFLPWRRWSPVCQLTDSRPGEGPLVPKPGQRFGHLGVILDSLLVLPVELVARLVRIGCVQNRNWGLLPNVSLRSLRFRYRTSLYSHFILVAICHQDTSEAWDLGHSVLKRQRRCRTHGCVGQGRSIV